MMTLDEFTQALETEFEDLEPGTLTPDMDYRNIKGWSSMHALIIIAFVDANFNIVLNGSDLKSAKTVRDLHAIVSERAN